MYVFGFGSIFDAWVDAAAVSPWSAHAGAGKCVRFGAPSRPTSRIYTAEQLRRRDSTGWTLVQAILAPLQFAVFLVSLALVLVFLATGTGEEVATASIVIKTLLLYAIMITGAVWEKVVFDRYLFAPAFFWEDVFSIVVLALHTLYLGALISGQFSADALMSIALTAYGAYVVNAAQYVMKFRSGRRFRSEAIGANGGLARAAE